LDHEGVDVDQRCLQHPQAQHDNSCSSRRLWRCRRLAEEDHAVGAVPRFDDVQSFVDLALQVSLAQVAGEARWFSARGLPRSSPGRWGDRVGLGERRRKESRSRRSPPTSTHSTRPSATSNNRSSTCVCNSRNETRTSPPAQCGHRQRQWIVQFMSEFLRREMAGRIELLTARPGGRFARLLLRCAVALPASRRPAVGAPVFIGHPVQESFEEGFHLCSRRFRSVRRYVVWASSSCWPKSS